MEKPHATRYYSTSRRAAIEYQICHTLSAKGATAESLSEVFGYTRRSMRHVLSRMKRDGLLTSSPNLKDARVLIYGVTKDWQFHWTVIHARSLVDPE